jgi:hypothetical protein
MMEAIRTAEPLVCFNETTRRYIPEVYHLHTYSRKNLKSHKALIASYSGGSSSYLGPVTAYPKQDFA